MCWVKKESPWPNKAMFTTGKGKLLGAEVKKFSLVCLGLTPRPAVRVPVVGSESQNTVSPLWFTVTQNTLFWHLWPLVQMALSVNVIENDKQEASRPKKCICLQDSLDSIYYCIPSGQSGLPNMPRKAAPAPGRRYCIHFSPCSRENLYLILRNHRQLSWSWDGGAQNWPHHKINSEFCIVPNRINIVNMRNLIPH